MAVRWHSIRSHPIPINWDIDLKLKRCLTFTSRPWSRINSSGSSIFSLSLKKKLMGQSISLQLVAAIFVACLATCWKILGSFLHGYLTRKMTVLYDLPKLGIPRPDHSRILGTAVIVGGRWVMTLYRIRLTCIKLHVCLKYRWLMDRPHMRRPLRGSSCHRTRTVDQWRRGYEGLIR